MSRVVAPPWIASTRGQGVYVSCLPATVCFGFGFAFGAAAWRLVACAALTCATGFFERGVVCVRVFVAPATPFVVVVATELVVSGATAAAGVLVGADCDSVDVVVDVVDEDEVVEVVEVVVAFVVVVVLVEGVVVEVVDVVFEHEQPVVDGGSGFGGGAGLAGGEPQPEPQSDARLADASAVAA